MAAGIDDQTLTITSEWEDSNVVTRLLIQEPMRTTLRFRSTRAPSELSVNAETTLNQPVATLTADLGSTMWLRKDVSETREVFVSHLNDLGVRTLADLLAAMGFRRYEVYGAGQLIFATDLPKIGNGNVRIGGTERK